MHYSDKQHGDTLSPTEKPLALKLADVLYEMPDSDGHCRQAAAELRRLHAENERLQHSVLSYMAERNQARDKVLEYRAAIEAALAPGEPVGWQPIETAPRDGTNVLVRFGSDGASQGKYIPGLPHPWQFIDTNNGISWLINHAVDAPGGPSHWMPLPDAAPQPQPKQVFKYEFKRYPKACSPAEDGVCEALECCKDTDPDILRESQAAWKNLSKVYKAAREADEYLLRQALEALEACLGWPQTIEALRERLK